MTAKTFGIIDSKQISPDVRIRTKIVKSEREKSKPVFDKKEKMERKIFIVKPECESQGRGIYLTDTWEDVDGADHVVA